MSDKYYSFLSFSLICRFLAFETINPRKNPAKQLSIAIIAMIPVPVVVPVSAVETESSAPDARWNSKYVPFFFFFYDQPLSPSANVRFCAVFGVPNI